MPGNPGLSAVIVSVPGGALTFAEDKAAGTYAGDAVVLARVADASGMPLKKQSQQYRLTGSLAELPRVRGGGLLFFRTEQLDPGRYKIQAAVHDGTANQAGTATASLEVPPTDRPIVGDLFIVAQVERADPNDPAMASHPLVSQGVLLYPSLGDPVSKAAQQELAFAVPIVTSPQDAALEAALELLSNGQSLARLPLPLDTPDTQGRLMQVSRLPLASIPSGTYDLRVTVRAGDRPTQRTTTVTIKD